MIVKRYRNQDLQQFGHPNRRFTAYSDFRSVVRKYEEDFALTASVILSLAVEVPNRLALANLFYGIGIFMAGKFNDFEDR